MNDLVKPGTPPPNYANVAPFPFETADNEKRPIMRKQKSCPGELPSNQLS